MNKKEYLLTCLSEECNEVAQRVSKALRFGLNEIQQGQELSNSQRIIYEFNDLIAVIEMLQEEGIITYYPYHKEAINKKKEKINKYIEYSRKQGTLHE